MTTTKPFQRGRFGDLPERPRIAHGYFETESLDVRVVADGFSPFRCHVKKHGIGPPLLLVHGLMTSSYSFRYVLDALGAHFTCYLPDLPGAGRSEAVVDAAYTPSALGRVLGALMQALGIKGAACVANSMGGYIAMVAALDPSRPASFSRLVVLHAPAAPMLRYRCLEAAFAIPGSNALFRALVRHHPEKWTHKNVHYFDESLKSLEEAREYAAPLRTDAGLEAFRRYLTDTMSASSMASFERALVQRNGAPFPMPLQLVYAREDPLVPPATGARLKELIPDAELVWLDGASHFMHVDAPEKFLATSLPFLGVTV